MGMALLALDGGGIFTHEGKEKNRKKEGTHR